MHTSVKGAKLELEACAWFLAKGYEVFRNVSPVGKADIVVWKRGDEPILIDVKSGNGYSKAHGVMTLTKIDGEFFFVEKLRSYRDKKIKLAE